MANYTITFKVVEASVADVSPGHAWIVLDDGAGNHSSFGMKKTGSESIYWPRTVAPRKQETRNGA